MRPVNFDHLAERLRNWGRWGGADQRGTLNHIGAETLKSAAAEVRAGKLFNLGLRFDREGPQLGRGRFNPMVYATDLFTPLNPAVPNVCYSDDVIHMPLQSATQWDALGHVHYDGQLYNSCNARECLTEKGALKMGINRLAAPGNPLARRAAGHRSAEGRRAPADRLCDHRRRPERLRRKARRNGEGRRHPGRAHRAHAALHPGWRPRRLYGTAARARATPARGVGARQVVRPRWRADNMAVEILHLEGMQSVMPLAFHMLALGSDMGMPLGEMFVLEALAADCADDGRYSFMLSALPLEVTGGFWLASESACAEVRKGFSQAARRPSVSLRCAVCCLPAYRGAGAIRRSTCSCPVERSETGEVALGAKRRVTEGASRRRSIRQPPHHRDPAAAGWAASQIGHQGAIGGLGGRGSAASRGREGAP